MDNILKLTACDLGRAIGSGEVNPVDVARTYLDAERTHPLGDRIYARMTEGRALAEATAAASRAKAGTRKGLLDGVPLSWKDLFDTAEIATEGGSALLKGRVPNRDAAVLKNATAAGMVCLGKTHMSELAFSGLGLNPSTSTPPCVNDADAVSGGSSSGAAASVAFRLAPCGIGSDTGGSIRLPAAWNDLVGFKPGRRSLPKNGVIPLCPSFDTPGPLARSVEDAAEIWAVLGNDAAPDLRNTTLIGARLMVLETAAMDDLAPQVSVGLTRAISALQDAGALVEYRDIPCVTDALDQSGAVFAPEAYGIWRETIEADPDAMYAQIRDRFRAGDKVSGPEFVAAWQTIDRIRYEYLTATIAFDAVILPTCPILPPTRARLEHDKEYYVSKNLMTLRNTRIGNLLGLAGVTLPTGVPSVGILFQTPDGAEGKLLRLAAAAERALA